MNAKVMALKKSVGKGAADKRKKKQVLEEIAAMELDMKNRHLTEREAACEGHLQATTESLASLDILMGKEEIFIAGNSTTMQAEPSSNVAECKKKSKKQAKLELKQQKEAIFEEEYRLAGEEADMTPKLKEVEDAAMSQLLADLGFCIKEIPADGHCLYRAVADQLHLNSPEVVNPVSFRDLRRLTAQQLMHRKDEFAPFLLGESGEVLNSSMSCAKLDEFDNYCDSVENGAVWAGEIEIRALSGALNREIRIYQAGSQPIRIGEDKTECGVFHLSYHKHSFGLGEHYNSVYAG